MCGIAGVRRLDGAPADERVLRAMTSRLRHRGPDGEGVWTSGPVGLGHTRLAIIDVQGSDQPMASHDGRHHICFNGEILNYREQRSRLSYPWRTVGDTEVLLAAFQEEGVCSVEAMRGQFAYAITGPDHSVWLFRDRLGILPLYYYLDDDQLVFASEIKAVLAGLDHSPGVDVASLDAYLTHRAVPAPHTLFEGIRKVPPAHRLGVDGQGRVTLERYWSVSPQAPILDVDDATAERLVEERLDEAVRFALVADVPVGAYLSGGLDSSLIVAKMVQHSGSSNVKTFAAGFDDPRVDELHHARTVSRALGTEHREVIVRPADFARQWAALTWHRDAPLSEPADVAVFHLASAARQEVKVVLSGEGSDELFAGYPKHRFARVTRGAGNVPAVARRFARQLAESALPLRAHRLEIAARALSADPEQLRMQAWFAPFQADERSRLLAGLPSRPPAQQPVSDDPLRQMLWLDSFGGWLADNLLERGDRMSMAASLELRPPFLDHDLVQTAFALPSRMKLRSGEGKWVIRNIARRYLPESITQRPKAGFRVPLDVWFRDHLRDQAHDLLLATGSFCTTVLDRRAVTALLADHAAGRRNHDIRLWTLMGLEIWHQEFFGVGSQNRTVAGTDAGQLPMAP